MSVIETLSNERFQKNLALGQAAETEIAKWLIKRGTVLLPIYDIEYVTGKGPRVFCKFGQYVAPDFFAWRGGRICWIEAKHKKHFAWNRTFKKWVTGIDLRHYENYCALADMLHFPVLLFFLHKDSRPSVADIKNGSPLSCPTGLFGRELQFLRNNVCQSWKRPPNHPDKHSEAMVYWKHETLRLISRIDEFSLDSDE